jgi:tight adherence protein C
MNLLFVLRAVALGVLAAAAVSFIYALGTAPRPAMSHLGLRGYKRTQSLRTNAAYRLIEPVLRFLSKRVHGLLSEQAREKQDLQLAIAGDVAGLQPEDVVSLMLLSATSGAALGIAYRGGGGQGLIFALILGLAGASIPQLYISSIAQARLRSIAMATPSMIDLLALCLGAGLDFPGALRQVVDRGGLGDDPLNEELRLLLQELNIGRTRRQALAQLARRAPCDAVRELVSAVAQSEEQGTPLADVLRVQAATSRMHRSARAEEVAAKAATSMMLPLAMLFVCVLVLIMGPVVLNFKNTINM